jgi:hypothetical protein
MNNYYPIIQSFFNTWNNFVSSSNTTVGVLSVEGGWFTAPQTINFPDGGRAKVIVSSNGDTFNTIEGSAYDCDNNQIPTAKGEFQGNFEFSTRDSFDSFNKYGSSFGVKFYVPVCDMRSLRTSCIQKPDGNHECTLRLNCN